MGQFNHKTEIFMIVLGIIMTGMPLLLDRKRSDEAAFKRKPSRPFLLTLLFAGVNLSGGSLNPDKSKNERAYGPNASARDIALGTTPVKVSPEMQAFTNALGREVRATSGKK